MLSVFLFTPLVLVNLFVNSISSPFLFSDIDRIPNADCVLILGASVYSDGSLSDALEDRADAAIKIYNAGKAKKILVSGFVDEAYNEPLTVKNYLLKHGIAEEDLLMDETGISTVESLKNAKNIFGIKSLIIPTQKFHVNRAVFDGIAIGLKVYGFGVEDEGLLKIDDFRRREVFGKVKDFFSF